MFECKLLLYLHFGTLVNNIRQIKIMILINSTKEQNVIKIIKAIFSVKNKGPN